MSTNTVLVAVVPTKIADNSSALKKPPFRPAPLLFAFVWSKVALDFTSRGYPPYLVLLLLAVVSMKSSDESQVVQETSLLYSWPCR